MRNPLLVLLLLSFASTLPAQILTTEVWVGALDMSEGRFDVSDLKNVSSHEGYDNQPAFFPDHTTLVYTSEIDGLADTGRGLHAVLVDLSTGRRTPLPEALGFSPTPSIDGKQLMMLREGGVRLHDLTTGKELRPLVETTTAGYYTRFDDRVWVLFMNEPERRIAIYDAKTKKLETMATGANTAPYRVPGQRAVTFVASEPFPVPEKPAADAPEPKQVLRRLDLKTRTVTTLATIPFASGGQHVWTSRGTLLMASGPEIFEWSPSRPEEWKPIYRADHPDLQGISRIAISPKDDRIALVSTPRDETIIRESRAAYNEALETRNAAAVAGFFSADGTLTMASGAHADGREAIEKAVAAHFEQRRDALYVRTPAKIDVSRSDPSASERGSWSGRWTGETGPVEVSGDYMAVWRRVTGGNGAPSWTVQTEVFAVLHCSGSGCGSR